MDSRMKPEETRQICACVHADNPCSGSCSCANQYQSGGCLCCASYGSEDQRRNASNRIVEIITNGHIEN